jgi:hypothetical protein
LVSGREEPVGGRGGEGVGETRGEERRHRFRVALRQFQAGPFEAGGGMVGMVGLQQAEVAAGFLQAASFQEELSEKETGIVRSVLGAEVGSLVKMGEGEGFVLD